MQFSYRGREELREALLLPAELTALSRSIQPFSCLSYKQSRLLLRRLASRFTPMEVESVADRKDKIKR